MSGHMTFTSVRPGCVLGWSLFPSRALAPSCPFGPPQNEQLLEDVEFYRYELNNNDASTKEKFQKKLGSTNYHLEQCLDDLQVPSVGPAHEWLLDHRRLGSTLRILLLDSF